MGRQAKGTKAVLLSTAVSIGIAYPAQAAQVAGQEQAAPAAASAPSPAPAVGETAVTAEAQNDATTAPADIVVTAQRRAQRLQDVPLSISVATGDALKNAAVTSVDRIEQILPGIRLGRSGSDLRPAIRGTYTELIGGNGDPRIGVYVDDIYSSRTSQVPPIVDLDRVEVQKGPQGTLYGRNSFGGNIAFFSALPTSKLGYGGDVLISSDERRAEAFLNLPITEGVGLRIAGLYDDLRPYVENVGSGNDIGGNKQKFVRGTLRIKPASIDALEVVLRGSYLDIGGSGGGGFGYKILGIEVDKSLIRAPGGSITVGGITYDLPNGFNGASFSGSGVPFDARFRDGIPDINGADVGIPVDPDPYRVNFAGDFIQRGSQKQFSGTINYDIGPVRLRSITSYTDFDITRSAGTLLPVLLNYSYLKTAAETKTQEFQLLSNDRQSPFQWIAGLYFLRDEVLEPSVTNVNRSYVTLTAPAGQQYFPFGFTFLPTGTGFNQTFSGDSFSALGQKTRSNAIFGQVSYTFADRLTVTGGVRRTTDRKTLASTRFNRGPTGTGAFLVKSIDDPVDLNCNGFIAGNAATVSVDRTAVAEAYQVICNKRKDSFTTYRAAADFKLTRNNMLYASYSTGAHSGGFNTGAFAVPTGGFTLIGFEPEFVTAYEVGSKNSFFDGQLTLNAAMFYNKYTDLHAQTSIPNPVNALQVISLVQNIGKDDAFGIDLEANWRPTRNLRVNAAYNYLHAREREYQVNTFSFGFCGITPSCVTSTGEANTVQGTPFPNVRTDPNRFVPLVGADGNPVVVGGVPQLRYVIAGRGRDGTRYVSRKQFSPDHTLQAGIAYDIELGGGATLTPEVQTYWNSGYILTDLTPDFGNQPSYTKTDLRLTFRPADDRFRVQAFVNNVENEAVITRAVYANNRSLQVTYGRPRVYGVSAGVRF